MSTPDPWAHTRPPVNQPVPGNPYAAPAPPPSPAPLPPSGYGPPASAPQGFGPAQPGPYNPPPAARAVSYAKGNPYATPTESLGEKGLKYLKQAGRIAKGLAPAIAIAAGMLANEPGMAAASSVWTSALSARLDDGIKALLPQILNTARDGWIARDRDELERVIWNFNTETGALRSVLGRVGSMLDEVAAGYRTFWTWVIRIAAASIAVAVLAKRLQTMPQTSTMGFLLEKYITTEVNISTIILATAVGSTLKESGEVMTNLIKKRHQFGYIAPGGDAAIDFKSITIDPSRYPSYAKPAKKDALPPNYQDFDWVEPKREPQPYGQ
jgi:hypothetical protein